MEYLLEALGTNDVSLQPMIKRVVTQLSELAKKKELSKAEFLSEVEAILVDTGASAPVTTTKFRQISDLSRGAVEWAALKRHGIAETKGQLHQEVEQLLVELGSRRLHIVPEGELEGWFRSASGRG